VIPVWLAFFTNLAVGLLSNGLTGIPWAATLVFSILCIAASIALVVGMPIVRLGSPDGKYAVGAISHTFTDPDRPKHEASSANGRRLFVKVWYPAENSRSNEQPRESVWQELHQSEDVPRTLRWMTSYLKAAHTNTTSNAPFADALSNPRFLVYNHGMISTASENTSLMEHLASHGFIVASIRHVDQLEEFQSLNSATPKAERESNQAIQRRLETETDRHKRAELSLESFRASSATNRIVNARAKDTQFVLNHATALVSLIRCAAPITPNLENIGALGLSLGGAVSTEFSKMDDRCAAVANMDGGLYGLHLDEPVQIPYLMMYSEQNAGCNDLLLSKSPSTVREVVLTHTKHMDFHDAGTVLPILRWLGALGRAKRKDTLAHKNKEVLEHYKTSL
jgi:hypothetical protein